MSCSYTFIVRAPIDKSILFRDAEGIALTEMNKSIISVLYCLMISGRGGYGRGIMF